MALTAKKSYALGMGPFPSGIYRTEFPYLYRAPKGYTEEEDVYKRQDEGHMMEIRENIKKSVETEFRSYGVRNLMVLSQANAVLILLPAELFSRDLLVTILTNIMKRGSEKYHIAIKAGVGRCV